MKHLTKLLSMSRAYALMTKLTPVFLWLSIIFFIVGVSFGLGFAPADYQQGDGFRIIYIHVPSAFYSLGLYSFMTVCAIVYWIWKIKVADVLAAVVAPVGALFALSALVTGSIWGKPMWGTWWIWDARLTSELILLFLYVGIIALRTAMPTWQQAAKACAILTLVGAVDLPVIHYSVYWWNTLHQKSTLLRLDGPSIDTQMLIPLLAMLVAVGCFAAWLVLIRARTEILYREQASQWVRSL